MTELSGNAAKGYRGLDQFALAEDSLSRRFPIYNPGDASGKPTGGLHQINYKLMAAKPAGNENRSVVINFS